MKFGAVPNLIPAVQQLVLDGLKVVVWCDVRGKMRLSHEIRDGSRCQGMRRVDPVWWLWRSGIVFHAAVVRKWAYVSAL